MVIYLVYVLSAAAIYWPLIGIRPLGGDNLYALAWVNHASFASLWTGDPGIYPEWRPLAYLSLWLEARAFGLDAVSLHFLINITLWAACAWLVYTLVEELTGERLPGVLAGFWLIFDRRAIESLSWIIERQTTLACLFGLLAVWVLARARHRTLTDSETALVGTALLACALSKEYGLAFAAVTAVYALVRRRHRSLVAATAALSVYAGARLLIADGAIGPYCQDMAFVHVFDRHCIDPTTRASVTQMAYNAGATVIGTLVPGLFEPNGLIGVDYSRVARGFGMLSIAGVGLYLGGPVVRMLALLPLFNGLLSFMIYRERNQLIGVCAVAIAAGTGLALWRRAAPQRQAVALHAAALAFVALVLMIRVADAHRLAQVYRDEADGLEPCNSRYRTHAFVDPFVEAVKTHYVLPNPRCD